jgi:CRP/FNR family transcriptional regulator, cyclic AMP receptor protein
MATNTFEHLRQFGRLMIAPPRSVILDANVPSEGAYLVTSGRVRLSLLNEDGTSLWSRTVGEGAILGLPSAIAREPQSIKAEALQPTELAFIEREKLAKLVKDNPAIGSEVVALLSAELVEVRRKWSMFAGAGKRKS